jgi:hypothetical protein
MARRSAALLAVGALLWSCAPSPYAKPTPAGNWTVVTEPFALAGRPVRLIFRFGDGEARPSEESFAFSVSCATCQEPKPLLSGTATKDPSGNDLTYSTTVTFPNAGSWYTSPYVGPIEVR